MQTEARPLRLRPARRSELTGLDPTLLRVYASRGVAELSELDYALGKLAPVRLLPNADAAVELLLAHYQRSILVVGDFDADGATSTALVARCLRAFGFARVDFLVPNRFEFGYGLSKELADVAARRSPSLIVTVDNGISSVAGVAAARAMGIDVLITDHHLPGSTVPDANVIVNPNLETRDSVLRNLAGVGVAFYLMASLGKRMSERGSTALARVPAKYLDLVALGTVADVVPLDHNNRVLVEQGLRRIRGGAAVPGIVALLRRSGRAPERAVSNDLGFAAGPRLNAAGRLEDMTQGIECLLTDDTGRACELAEQLDQINASRRNIEASMRERAFAIVDTIGTQALPSCIALFERDWHAGVVGLIAARVRERYHRPAFAFAIESDGKLKGSGRSVADVHLRDLLEAVDAGQPGLLLKYGGHAMAAGLTIRDTDFARFGQAVAATLTARYPALDCSGAIVSDGVLPIDRLTTEFAAMLRAAGPWGAGFPEPTFHGDFHVVDRRVVGERHLKMRVIASGSKQPIDAIAFNQVPAEALRDVRLAYRLDLNEYRGTETAQLVVEQIAPL